MLNETIEKVIERVEKVTTLETSVILLIFIVIGTILFIRYKSKQKNKIGNTKEIKGMSEEASSLRKEFRKEYTEIAEEFGKLAERMDNFLAEMEIK